MRRYLTDSNLLAAYLLDVPYARTRLEPRVAAGEAATSALVCAEVDEYLRSRRDYALRHAQLRAALQHFYPFFPTYAILDLYGELRRALRPPTGPGLIGDIDVLIAATAIVRKLTLVTTDADFQRVPGLSLELIDRERLRR